MEYFQRKLFFVVFVLLSHFGGVYVLSSEAPIYGLDALHSIPDEYIIVHKTHNSKTKTNNLLSSIRETNDVTVLGDYNIGTKRMTVVKGPLKVVQTLRHLSEVAFIEANQRVSYHEYWVDGGSMAPGYQIAGSAHSCYIQSTGYDLWGLSRINKRQKPYRYTGLEFNISENALGSGVDVYVVDTGVYIDHDDLRGRAVWGFTASSVIDEGHDDLNGHGTHVAGTAAGSMYGVAKQANIISVKVLNGEGSGSISGTIDALAWISQKETAKQIQGKGGRAVVNLSLGTSTVSYSLDSSVQGLIEDGIPAVVAAGNDYSDACNSSPARVASAITVGATDRSDKIAYFSNYGTCVSVMAPGYHILSSYIGSPSSFEELYGTSMATPHVTGVSASYLSSLPNHIKPTPAELKDYLVDMATKGAIDYEYYWQESTPDRLLYIASCESPTHSYTTTATSTTPTTIVYEENTTPTTIVYEENTTPTRNVYEENTTPTRNEYEENTTPTRNVYEENTTPTRNVSEENASTSITADAVLCFLTALLFLQLY